MCFLEHFKASAFKKSDNYAKLPDGVEKGKCIAETTKTAVRFKY